jgi:outer membrane protein insertion porin family
MGPLLAVLLLTARLAAGQTDGPAAVQMDGGTADADPLVLDPLGLTELPPEGPPVASIEIRSEVELNEEQLTDLQRLITFEPGDPLTDEEIARTLRNVQASGIASEVELYTRPAEEADGTVGDRLVAMLVLRPVVRVSEVRLEGDLGGLREGELRRAVPQNEAEPLNEERVVQGVFQLLDFYDERGYFDADVRVRVATNPETRQSVVTYQIQAGARAQVGAVELQGPIEPFTPAALAAQLEIGPGDPFSRREARDSADRLQTWLIRQGHRTARVDAPETPADPQTRTVRLVYPIEVGPRVELLVVGAEERQLRRRGLLSFLGDQGFDEALVLQSTRRLRDFYQREGHYKVGVDFAEEQAEGVLGITLSIVPGPEYTLRQVDFTGNETFRDERLAELMTTAGRSLLNLGSGRLVDSELERDLDNIRSFYALQGYGQAEVGPPQVIEQGQDLRLEIPVVEGPRQQVVELRFEGIESIDPGALNLPLRSGGPFHPFLLEQTLGILRQTYGNQGYAEAQVSAGVDWNQEQTLADVTIRVLEGERMTLDRVIVRGNQRTESGVIERTLGVDPGDAISENRRLEIERDLYRLGIFSRVQVELSRAGPGSAARDLIVRVEEGRPRRLSYGLGIEYGSEDEEKLRPRGSFGFVHNNVAGKAFSLRTDLRVSESDQSFRVLFDQPYTGRYPVPLTYSLFFFNEEKENWDVVRWGGRVEAIRTFSDRRASLAYDYRHVETSLSPGFGLGGVDREDRPYELSSLIPGFLWDRRNDPVLATRGWSSFAQAQWAYPLLGSDGDFVKLFLQQTQYVGLDHFGVLAASLRVGGIEPFSRLENDDPELPEDLPNANIFIDERFFAGGATTHRAYARDELGIRGRTLEVGDLPDEEGIFDISGLGGNGLLLLNLEYRFPVFGPVEGVAFYDTGNVWADWREIDLGELKSGAGLGVRYLSPIGPLRLDVGWKLDREPFEEATPVYQISFGNPF